jgi:hypothetical protein
VVCSNAEKISRSLIYWPAFKQGQAGEKDEKKAVSVARVRDTENESGER